MCLSDGEFTNVCVSVEQYLKPPAGQSFACALDTMLGQATLLFGPRDRSFTVTVIDFGEDHPKISYPWLPAGEVSIRLSEGAYRWGSWYEYDYSFWQLAHECVHLLSPTPGRQVSVLEEGIACYFQSEFMKAHYGYEAARQHLPSFIRAETLTRQLLTHDVGVVSRLRRTEPVISQITAALIMKECPSLPRLVAESLAQRFYRGT